MFFKILGLALLYIILLIIIVIAIALACPVKIIAFSNEEKKLKLLYKWLFFTFGKKPNPSSPTIAFVKRVTGISRFENIENINESISSKGLEESIKGIITVIQSILHEIKYLLPKCTIESFKLNILCSTSDAAQTSLLYGGVCAVVYPAIGVFYSVTKQKKHSTEINIMPDFKTQKSDFSVYGRISCVAFFLLVAFLRFAFKYYKNRKTII